VERASGLGLVFSRCNAPSRASHWNRWMLDEHVPVMAEADGVRAATHWALTVPPTPGG